MLEEQVHRHFAEMLSGWGATPEQVEDTLRWAWFGLGLVRMSIEDGGPPVVGIVVDEEQDEELARLFAMREELKDEAFLAQWKPSSQRASRVLLDPRGPRAVLRYTVGIERPERLERQFLFLVHSLEPRLAELQQPGTSLALIPQRVVEGNIGRTASAYDVLSYCLPLGEVEEPLAGLEEALAHVRNSRPSVGHGSNRAQRRARRRKEGQR